MARAETEAGLKKIPNVSGDAGQLYLSRELARVFDTAEKAAQKAGDSFVTVERLLLALVIEKDTDAGKILAVRRRHAERAQRGDRRHPQGPHRRLGLGREPVRCAQEIRARPDRRRCATASSTR